MQPVSQKVDSYVDTQKVLLNLLKVLHVFEVSGINHQKSLFIKYIYSKPLPNLKETKLDQTIKLIALLEQSKSDVESIMRRTEEVKSEGFTGKATAKDLIGQIRSAIRTLSTSTYMKNPHEAPIGKVLKTINPLIDQLIRNLENGEGVGKGVKNQLIALAQSKTHTFVPLPTQQPFIAPYFTKSPFFSFKKKERKKKGEKGREEERT